jgi:glycerol-3-phosphate dehydrogenase
MTRSEMLDRATGRREPWDIVVIGGGATGVGVAVDAAARGYAVLLLEQHDFGKGTSSRSTKLVHGGVRYLERGNIGLVMEALKERGRLLHNAPHLVRDLAFVVPTYAWWEKPFYGLGLKLYNLLSGKYRLCTTKTLSKDETLRHLPTIRREGLRGGVLYHDGQFDDARLLLNLAATAAEHGAVLLNYAPVVAVSRAKSGRVFGVTARDTETGREFAAEAKVVVNATGAFCDGVRRLADAGATPMVAPSQGVHLVFDRSFLPGPTALMVPHTPDKRVMFAIPWHGHTLVGTTDVAVPDVSLEPRASDAEVDFILETAGRYLAKRPTRADVLSVFAGVRPLVKVAGTRTAALPRDHTIHVDADGLVTITGGKWTTYRQMAEDCVNHAATLGRLEKRPCPTRSLRIHGWQDRAEGSDSLGVYGSDAAAIRELMREDATLAAPLHPNLPYREAEVLWALRREMARTVEDVLARRTRALFLNARAAIAAAPRVAELIAAELGRDGAWRDEQVREFDAVARGYCISC